MRTGDSRLALDEIFEQNRKRSRNEGGKNRCQERFRDRRERAHQNGFFIRKIFVIESDTPDTSGTTEIRGKIRRRRRTRRGGVGHPARAVRAWLQLRVPSQLSL